MNWAFAIPIILSVLGGMTAFGMRILSLFAQQIRLQTEIKEKVSLAQVGIECLQIVDQDVKNQLAQTEQRLSDVERYLQTQSPNFDRPFILRNQVRK